MESKLGYERLGTGCHSHSQGFSLKNWDGWETLGMRLTRCKTSQLLQNSEREGGFIINVSRIAYIAR